MMPLFLVHDACLRSYFKNSCFVFHRGFQTLENNTSTSFLVFGNPDETFALVFEILRKDLAVDDILTG